MISLLYVDDEPELLNLAKLFLEREGEFTVTTTTSSRKCLDLLADRSFDAIISDYQMPAMDGIELLKQVRSRGLSTPFILFTGKGREEVVIEAINNGADFYLQKGGAARPQFAELRHKIIAATERRRAIDALRESETKYRELVENAGSIILKMDPAGNITFFNEFAQSFFGFTMAEILGKPVIGTIVPAYESASNRDLTRMIENIITHPDDFTNNENENITKSGKRVYIHWWNKPLYDKNGAFEGVLCVGTDITARKQFEDELRAENDKNRGLMNNANDAIFIMDAATGMFADANRRALELVGRSLAELQDMHLTRIFPAEYHEMYLGYFSDAAKEGSRSHSLAIVDSKGRMIPEVVSFTMLNIGDRPHVMGIFHDIAEIKMAQDALQLANRKLNLLSDITRHDIRNKLTILEGYLELSRGLTRDPDHSMYIRKIQDIVKNISENIEFTRLYQNLGVAAPDWQNVHNVFFHACTQIDIRKICVQSDTGALEIYADPLLERAFFNIADNAVTHGGRVTRIRISAQETLEGALIVIEDNG
ncbi:MAG: PAS domain S-box protein, partial [Methanoregula sp.]